MKTIQHTRYKCEICGAEYSSASEAKTCEARPVTHDRGVKVGDKVQITAGDGAGGTATVERITVITKDWGHYAWERYWHTVAVEAKVDDGWGHRFLTFDNYEPIATAREATQDQETNDG